ncbi:4-phosphoerythronate dehydrogenase [Marinicella rhabdoformis]|uniref:4-phosphoerythronate dehydrogenase n=1 Tax=Marinicella rhabdoformis TaxID=2580566 RepID=UPI0012AEBF51|nr:4-phosphoerythronate dehydrogenase [Marinicella rhabdoformis]
MSEPVIHILADENMPALSACFGSVAQIKTTAGRDISHKDLQNVDALLVRSVTQVNADLLCASDVQFVGSATIGTDHIDQAFLDSRNIEFVHAPGSNAQSVVEYVITAVALWCQKHNKSPKNLKFGIIGKGQIGSRLFDFLNDLGVTVVCCDPPLEHAGIQSPWHGMEAIQQCDVISCHVPLTAEGAYATKHLIDEDFMSGMKSGALLINSSRGPVVDNASLLNHLKAHHFEAVLDVWETEPVIELPLMDAVFLATPHIAGYAYEAKIRGTFMLYQAFCQHFKLKESVVFDDLLPAGKISTHFKSVEDWLSQAPVLYDLKADDSRMRQEVKKNAYVFDNLRKNYPKRREFLRL